MSESTESLRFSADHCWARRTDRGEVTVGITPFAQSALGTIVFAGLPDVGAVAVEGAPLGEVESTKAVSELYAPLSGSVVAVNTDLTERPDAVNRDPLGAGWMYVISPSDPSAFERLLDPDAYAVLTEDEPSTKD